MTRAQFIDAAGLTWVEYAEYRTWYSIDPFNIPGGLCHAPSVEAIQAGEVEWVNWVEVEGEELTRAERIYAEMVLV